MRSTKFEVYWDGSEQLWSSTRCAGNISSNVQLTHHLASVTISRRKRRRRGGGGGKGVEGYTGAFEVR
ncbi:hypothetical protein E2C01_079585 [Portunus trituberculatus]|uniref:Uncharacterized protein n=1 Tax=Portunus trituberculatus TaxID=210409 RepID=A0A5B7IQQ0_PORTR|nr:hypothetical protein [Portunus trituberculatus]